MTLHVHFGFYQISSFQDKMTNSFCIGVLY